jgi:m7GpppX diphosphatase
MRDKTLALLASRYGIATHLITAFVHYFPAYYHFHVHFTHVSYDSELTGARYGRGHALDDIIDNLTLDSAYYQKKTLTLVIPANHPMYSRFLSAAASSSVPVASAVSNGVNK